MKTKKRGETFNFSSFPLWDIHRSGVLPFFLSFFIIFFFFTSHSFSSSSFSCLFYSHVQFRRSCAKEEQLAEQEDDPSRRLRRREHRIFWVVHAIRREAHQQHQQQHYCSYSRKTKEIRALQQLLESPYERLVSLSLLCRAWGGGCVGLLLVFFFFSSPSLSLGGKEEEEENKLPLYRQTTTNPRSSPLSRSLALIVREERLCLWWLLLGMNEWIEAAILNEDGR